jgi:hypothetical protein
MSSTPPVEPEPDGYDLAPESPAPQRAVRPQAVPTARPTLDYRGPQKKENLGPTDTETLKNFQLPLALLIVGMVVKIIGACITGHNIAMDAAYIGIDLVLGTAVTLAGVMLAAKIRGIQLGEFRFTLLKLAAICVFPSAAFLVCMIFLRFIPILGVLLGLGGEFMLYFALLGVFFDLEESDTWYVVFIIFLVNLGVYFALKSILSAW